MKQILLPAALFLTYAVTQAQTLLFTVDSTCFNALTLESGRTQVRLSDINQDGNLDVVSIGDHGSPNVSGNQHGITVFFGNGTGSGWSLSQSGSFGYGGCAVGDLNNDGKQDIAYGMHHNYGGGGGSKIIEAQLGSGSGMSWTPYDGGLATGGETYGMGGVDLGDINNDGLLDIGCKSMACCNGVHVYKNLGAGSWQQSFSAGQGGGSANFMQFGDMDGDGNLDFVVAQEFGSPYFGNGTGGFAMKAGNLPVTTTAYDSYLDVSLGDIDNDGDDDFAFNPSATNPSGVFVYKWNKGTLQWDNASAGLPSTGNCAVARLADMDMDGFLDLVTVNVWTLQVWKGNGGTNWTNILSDTLPKSFQGVRDIALADVDHNGKTDILLWGSFQKDMFNSANKIWLFKQGAPATDLSVLELYPKGGECIPNNAARFINWISAVPANHASSVKIEYSTTGNSGPWTLITASAPNNGTYQWNAPASVNSSNCFIRITATDNVTSGTAIAVTANPFSIGCNTSTTGVSESAGANGISVFPNPFSSTTMIFSSANNCSIKIIDITGNIVRSFSNVDQFPFTIERSNLASGIYVLEVSSATKTERVKLLVE